MNLCRFLTRHRLLILVVIIMMAVGISAFCLIVEKKGTRNPRLRPTRHDLIIYNRIPKTGSTSVIDAIGYQLFDRNRFHILLVGVRSFEYRFNSVEQARFVRNVTSWRRPALYHGHFCHLDFTKFGFRNPIYIAVVRDPIERLISYYYFIPFFCGNAGECWRVGSRWALSEAKHNLVNLYALVGITEDIGYFVLILEKMFPAFFSGAEDAFRKKSKQRKTQNKIRPSIETLNILTNSSVMAMEIEFYRFATSVWFDVKERFINNMLYSNLSTFVFD